MTTHTPSTERKKQFEGWARRAGYALLCDGNEYDECLKSEIAWDGYQAGLEQGIQAGRAAALAELQAGGVGLPPAVLFAEPEREGEFHHDHSSVTAYRNCPVGWDGLCRTYSVQDYGDRREAHGIEKGKALAIAELRAGGVELPEPSIAVGEEMGEFTFTEGHYIESKLLDYGDRRAAAAVQNAIRVVTRLLKVHEDRSSDDAFNLACAMLDVTPKEQTP